MAIQDQHDRFGTHEPLPEQWRQPITRDQRKIVIVGGGVAALSTAQSLRRRGFTGSLTGLTAEPLPPYERPLLSKAALTDPHWPGRSLPSTAKGFFWSLGLTATRLDLHNREIEVDDGGRVGFDALVIATGRRAARLPFAPAVPGLRTIADAMRLRAVLHGERGRLAVIGGGLLGAEVAAAARTLDWHVTVIDAEPRPLAGTLGGMPAKWLWERHREHGVRLRFGSAVAAVRPSGRGHRVECADGSATDADVVVACVGTTANTHWLAGSGLDVRDGVRTDERQQVRTTEGAAASDVVAVGDVAETPSGGHHWETAIADGERAAAALLDEPAPAVEPPAFSTKVYGHRLDVVGVPRGAEGELEPTSTGFLVHYHDRGVLVGATVLDSPALLAQARRAIRTSAA